MLFKIDVAEIFGQGKNPKLPVSSYFYIYWWWVILGYVRLCKGWKVPRSVKKLAAQGLDIGEKILWKNEETGHLGFFPRSEIFVKELITKISIRYVIHLVRVGMSEILFKKDLLLI